MNPYVLSKMIQHTQQEIARANGKRNWRLLFRIG